MSTLYVVATPIGNLGDFSQRAIETLKKVNLILCEDTRVSKKLLARFDIKTATLSYHQHSKLKRVSYIIDLLGQGRNLALISDAGTPAISDPGSQLVKEVVRVLGDKVKIVAVPGPSALTAAVSIAGLSMDKFLFLGFPPAKRKRQKFFEQVVNANYPVVFYESPHRIIKTLQELKTINDKLSMINDNLLLVVCRELTKKFETTYRGTIDEVIAQMEKDGIRGEFVVIAARQQR